MKTKGFSKRKGKRGRKEKKLTIITREYIEYAVDEYLKNGGKIKKLSPVKRKISDILAIRDSSTDIDEFLSSN